MLRVSSAGEGGGERGLSVESLQDSACAAGRVGVWEGKDLVAASSILRLRGG